MLVLFVYTVCCFFVLLYLCRVYFFQELKCKKQMDNFYNILQKNLKNINFYTAIFFPPMKIELNEYIIFFFID